MQWMLLGDADGGTIALIGAIGAAIGVAANALGTWIMHLIKDRRAGRKEERADAIAEWQRLQEQTRQRADAQEKQIYTLLEKNSECEKRAAELAGEVKILTLQVRRLQQRADDTEPASYIPVTITTDSLGTILNVSPTVAPLLHWLPKELYGRNLRILVPDRHWEKHEAAFQRVVASAQAPDPSKVVLTEARTKEGEEVPVSISPSGWQDTTGKWFFNAEIKRRYKEPGSGDSVKGLVIKK